MDSIFPCYAGLDIHKQSVEACVQRMDPHGQLHQETRPWGTMTRDLRAMADWMAAQRVTQVRFNWSELGPSLPRPTWR